MRIALPRHVDLDALAVVLYAKYQKPIDAVIDYLKTKGYIIRHPIKYYSAWLNEQRLGNLDTFEQMDLAVAEERKRNYEI